MKLAVSLHNSGQLAKSWFFQSRKNQDFAKCRLNRHCTWLFLFLCILRPQILLGIVLGFLLLLAPKISRYNGHSAKSWFSQFSYQCSALYFSEFLSANFVLAMYSEIGIFTGITWQLAHVFSGVLLQLLKVSI